MLLDEKTPDGSEEQVIDETTGQPTNSKAEKPAEQPEKKPEETPKPKGRAETRIQQLIAERNDLREKLATKETELAAIPKKEQSPEDKNELAELTKMVQKLNDKLSDREKADARRVEEEKFEAQVDSFMDKNPDLSEDDLDIITSIAVVENGVVDLEGALKRFNASIQKRTGTTGGGALTTAPSRGAGSQEKPTSKMTPEQFDDWAKSKLTGKV